MDWLNSGVQVWQLVLVAVGVLTIVVIGWIKGDGQIEELQQQVRNKASNYDVADLWYTIEELREHRELPWWKRRLAELLEQE